MQSKEQTSGVEFIRRLRLAGVEADDRLLAEMIWLSRLMTPEAEPEPQRRVSRESFVDTGKQAKPETPLPAAPVARGTIEIITWHYPEEPVSELFVNTAVGEDGKVRASRKRVTGVPALPEAEAIARGLRPFQRRVRRAKAGDFDAEATVERVAESDLILPVLSPAREKWFDAVVVFEDRPAMVVWRETIREFRRMLERQGAFRDAQLWRLVFPVTATDAETSPSEPRQIYMLSNSGAARDLTAIREANAGRVVFLFSDGVSGVWRDGQMRKVIEAWGAQMPVVLVQPLDAEQWVRTAHGDPQIRVRAPQPGSPNRKLELAGDAASTAEGGFVRLPVVMASPRSLARWAAMLMKNDGSVPALLLPEAAAAPHAISPRPAAEVSVQTRLDSLTDPARKLLRYLSAVPLQMPVMRLVQRVMLPDSRIEHLAEIMLSGLVKRLHPEQSVAKLAEDEIDFDFISKRVRDDLVHELRFGELDVVLHCVSDYVSDRIGRRCELRTLIEDSEGALSVLPEALPFARIAARALALHGIRPKAARGTPIEGRATGWVTLTPFDFTTVTLDARGNPLKRNGRRRLSARQFTEDHGGLSLEMVEIPGGTFLMGSPKSKNGHRDREGPQRRVSVPPFYIGKFTITQRQWSIVAGWEKIENDLPPDPSRFRGDDRPVDSINWFQAKEFCARLAKQTGNAYRLPTEAEWEYACRAGTTTPFAFGETITPEFVNYNGGYPYGKAKKGQYRGETMPVGSLGVANAFGLFDMHGNVWEWCEDFWHDSYEDAPLDGSAWLSGGDSSSRVVRGGSWYGSDDGCRSACRLNLGPGLRDSDIGLRVVVSART